MKTYRKKFYAEMEISSVTSAKEIIPMLIDKYSPISVVDLGCGTGAFAREFIQNGVTDVIGLEGEWMRSIETLLEKEKYVYVDFTKEIATTRKYDLCLCLEVAEHLDSSSARTLVSTLISLSPRVVFSAAIPLQGGNHHVNEQWPDFWASLFAERGYILDWDPRLSIWNNSSIAPCYRQNLLVFKESKSEEKVIPLSLVHPEAWTSAMKYRKAPLRIRVLHKFPSQFLKIGKNFLNKVKGVVK